MTGWLSLAIVAMTLVCILIRPWRVAEAWVAAAGAVAMLAIGAIHLHDIRAVLDETGGVLLFLFGMMILTGLAERAGLFTWLAEGCARLAGGSGRLLFCLIFVLGAVITALLSLDVTVIMLTPIVYALTVRRRLDALPFMFACTFVANTASLLLPISNLTNLLVYSQQQTGFFAFAGKMWLPNLAAVTVNLAIFLWLFRDRLPRRFEPAADCMLPKGDWWLAIATIGVSATLIGLLGLGLANLPLAWASLAGGVSLAVIGLASRRTRPREIADDVSWLLFVFIIAMFLVVRGFEHAWLSDLATGLPSRPLPALLTGVIGGAIGSNIVNNVPMVVLALSLVAHVGAEARTALTYGSLVGVNIGPTLTTYGSLATMLWLTLVRKRGLEVSTAEYMKVGLLTMPPVLLTATAALWLTLR